MMKKVKKLNIIKVYLEKISNELENIDLLFFDQFFM